MNIYALLLLIYLAGFVTGWLAYERRRVELTTTPPEGPPKPGCGLAPFSEDWMVPHADE